MILLFNVKITQYGLSHYARAHWLPVYNRVDIFKYCLASYTAMLPVISKSIFCIELAPEFADRQAELEEYINRLYPGCTLHWYRNFLTRDWRNNWDDMFGDCDDDTIWFAGNDDHIFIDYNLEVLNAGLSLIKNDPDPMTAIFYSHWAFQCRIAKHYNGQLTDCGNYIKYTWRTYDAVRILRMSRFKHYWFDNDFGELAVYRTDALYHAGHDITSSVYAPTRELVRHYDGDSHIGNLTNTAPPLVIPEGFFTDDIKIRIGYTDRKNEWVNLNPSAAFLYGAREDGADYRWVEQDIPLFWRDKITEVDISPDYDIDAMTQARDRAFIAMTQVPMYAYNLDLGSAPELLPPEKWYSKHLRHVKN